MNSSLSNKILKLLFPKLFPIYKLFYFEQLENSEFNSLISSIYYENAWKTTAEGRHIESDKIVQRLLKGKSPVILDVGVSNGVTSLDLIKKLENFSLYFLVDKILYVDILKINKNYFFLDKNKRCFILSNPKFSILLDKKTIFPLIFLKKVLSFLCEKRVRKSEQNGNKKRVLLLDKVLQERVKTDKRFRIVEWDILDRWKYERVDFIKIANVLNKVYFSLVEMEKIIGNLYDILNEEGLLFVIENRDVEKLSVFKKYKSGFRLMERLNNGVEIENIFLGFKPEDHKKVDSPNKAQGSKVLIL